MTQRIEWPIVAALLLASVVLMADRSEAVRADDAPAGQLSPEDQQALEVGRQVIAVRNAIKDYDSPDSLKAITDAGTITTNYVWVRGWLNEELRTATHMLDVRKDKPRDELEKKVAFLRRAIRAIDLE